MQDNINKLYNVLKNDGYEDLGTEDKFRNFVNDSANVKKLYGVLKNDGYEDLGTEDDFMAFVMPNPQSQQPKQPQATAPAPQAAQPKPRKRMIETSIYGDRYKPKNYQEGYKPQPTAVPPSLMRPDEDTTKTRLIKGIEEGQNAFNYQQQNTPFARSYEAAKARQAAVNKPAFPDIEAPQLSRSVGDEREKLKGMVTQNMQRATDAKSKTAFNDAVKNTYEQLAEQGFNIEALDQSGMINEGIENVLVPSAEAAVTKGKKIIDKVFDDAKAKANKARTDATRYTGMGGLASAASSNLIGDIAYNKELDPDKLQTQLIDAIDKNGLRETFKEVYRQASKYGIDPKDYFNAYVAPHLKDNAAKALDKFMTDQYMPKNDAEYVLSGFSNSITGMLTDWLTKNAKQNAYKQIALSKYDASTGINIAREAVGLIASAPEFIVSGGVASAATKKLCGKAIQNMVAKGFTKAQAQRILTSELATKFGQRMAERIIQSSISGGANFGTLESMSEAARQLRDDDFDAGNIAIKGAQGIGKGIVFGATSGSYAAATSELTGATKIISNFLGIPANGLSLTLSSNAINEVSMLMGGEDELAETDENGNRKRKPFMEQWADNTLLDLMMRGTSHQNLNVVTSQGRSDLTARMKSFFSPLSDSQKMFGKSWGEGISEEGKARLMGITGTDNLRDALTAGMPKITDMPSLPYRADRIEGKTRSKSFDDILRDEQRKVMEQNWDNIMHDRELTADDKAKLCMIMGAKFHTNPSVTMKTVTKADGVTYVEYRDAAGMLNERVPLGDADLSMEAQNKLRMRNIYGKTSALGKQGEYAVTAGAMRYAMKPDAEGNIPTEEQQKKRASEYFDRFRKGELTETEITELELDLDKATLSYDGADKIKVQKHADGTASVQYSKNGVPVRTDHFATEEEANERASRDLYQQQLNSINEWREDVGIPLDDGSKLSIEQVYELKNNMPLGTLQQAIEGYPGMSMDEVRDKLLNSGLTSVDLVTGPDGIIRTAEQDKLIQDYYDWAKKTVEGMDAKKAQPDTGGLYQMGEGGDPDSITPAFKAPETPNAENGLTTRTHNGPTTEEQAQQPEPQPQAAPEQPYQAPKAPEGSNQSYSDGYNAVSSYDIATVARLNDNYELANRRIAENLPKGNPVSEDVLALINKRSYAEAHALVDNTPMPEEEADALHKYIEANAAFDGMNDAMEQIKNARIREYQAKVEAQAQENGEDVTIVVLDKSGKKAKLVKGDLNDMKGTVMIQELENDMPVGQPRQEHVKNIKRVFPTQKVKDMIFAERKRIQQDIDAYFDNAVSPVNFEIGKKVVLKDGENIVEATVVGMNPNGSINFESATGEVMAIDRAEAEKMATDAKEENYKLTLQAEENARAEARRQAQAQQQAQAEAEAKRQAEEAARKAEEERRKNPLNRLKRREDKSIDYTNSNPDDVAELLQNLGAKGKDAAVKELAKVQKAIKEAEAEASAEQEAASLDELLEQTQQGEQRNARVEELKRQEVFWQDQINRIAEREEAIRKEEERKAAEKLKQEQKRMRSIATFNKPINDARKRMADDPDAMQILEENNREPRTLKEAVADLIPKNGLVLKNWTDANGVQHLGLEGEIGISPQDMKRLSYFIGKLENGATDITTLAERIYEDLPENLKAQAGESKDREIRDLIIELLSEAQNADHIIHYIDNARIREAEAVYEANKSAEAEYERAMAEHSKEVENETAPTYSAEEDPFSGSAAEAPFSFRGIKTDADRERHNERVRRVGGLILDSESDRIEEKSKALLDTIGRQLGKAFVVDRELADVNADGLSIDNVIYLSPKTVMDGDKFTRKISGHELTHAIKRSSKDVQEVWDKFLKFVQESISKEEYDKRVDEKLSLYREELGKIINRRNKILEQANPTDEDLKFARKYANVKMPTRKEMEEEVACDFVGEHILTDEKFINDLVERVEQSKADSKSIIQRMRAFIDKMLAYLNSLTHPTSADRRARVALERARDIWADMYELSAAKQREDLIGNAEAGEEAFSIPKFSIIKSRDKELTEDDRKAIEDLNSGDKTRTKTVYRAMQVIDGKLYPPMAAKVGGKLVESAKEGDILKADEHPELIKMINGKPQFILDKGGKDATGKKASSVPARYNPYWHTSNSPMNDQFKSAWIRPNMVTVECEIPVSELTSGYKAEYAKDAVGMVPWKSGSVTGELVKQGHPGREVYLSRYCKIGRVLSDAETAQMIKDFIGDKDVSIPENVVTPKVRAELEKLGVKIGEPEKGVNKTEQIEEAIANGLEVDKKTILGERGGAVSGNPSSKNLPLEGSEHLSHRALTLPKDAAKLQKNSEITINSAKKIINSGELKGKTDTAAQAVSALGHSLHLEKSGSSQSYYQDYYEGDFVVDGKVARVRISTHPATGKRIGNAPVDDKISIVIYKDGEHKDRGAHNGYVEYIYHPENISPKDASMAIVKSIEGLIRNGEYVDETGLAQKQEYPYVDDKGDIRFSFANESGNLSEFNNALEEYKELDKKYDGQLYRNPDMTPEDVELRKKLIDFITNYDWSKGKKQNEQPISDNTKEAIGKQLIKEITDIDADRPSSIALPEYKPTAEGRARKTIYSSPMLKMQRQAIQDIQKEFGRIGNASDGAFYGEDGVRGVADPKKAKTIAEKLMPELETYREWLENYQRQEKAKGYQRVFDDAIADVDKAIKWYSEFGEGQHQRLGDHEDAGIKFSVAIEKHDPFYSNAAKAVTDIKQERGTGEQWLKMIEKQGGLKKEEDKWMGLSDWLKGKKSVTKAEVQKFIAENSVKVEDVNYTNNELAPKELQDKFKKYMDRELRTIGSTQIGDAAENAWRRLVDEYGDDFKTAFWLNYDEDSKEYQILIDDASVAESFVDLPNRPINYTRLGYTTEGLENKREIALVVPDIEPYNEHDEIHFGDAGEGRAVAWVRFGDTETHDPEIKKSLDSASEELYDYLDRMSEKYETNPDHPEQIEDKLTAEEKAEHQRIMANIRKYDEANNANTKKVLVIDEIQSKRHQDARDKGYKDKRLVDIENRLDRFAWMGGDITPEQSAERDRLRKEYAELRKQYGDTDAQQALNIEKTVPDAPFQKNWHELALKRMLRYAAENGYDKIAWTTGNQQAERYNIGGVVPYIDVKTNSDNADFYRDMRFEANGSGCRVAADKDGKITLAEGIGDAVGKSLAEVFGKDVAMQIMEADREKRIQLEGKRIGGEGMQGFYDQMLPRFMDKYGKKWGVKTQDVELDLPNAEDRIMHSVDVTDAMKESVMQGQPMFSIKRDKEYADAVAAGDKEKVDAMIREEMKAKGYTDDSSYQGTSAFNGAAPSTNAYFETREERKEAFDNDEFEGDLSLGDMRSGIDKENFLNRLRQEGALARRRNANGDKYMAESSDALLKAMTGRKKTITMYRSVPSSVKEDNFRNGDWVTPSEGYAMDNADVHGWGEDYRIIKQEVPIDDVWWDGNDINEWGYDDGKGYAYKNTANNRKLLEPTYDDKGNLIPLSKRFDENNPDVKFSLNRSDRIYDKRKIDPKKLESAKVLVDEIKGKYMGSIIPENDVRPFVDALKDVAEIAPKKEILNNENYKDVFGEGVESPIGHVKMSDNQMNKMLENGRQGRLYFAYRTLRCPDLILQKPSKAKEGQETERPYSYLYVKTFANEDGTETTFYYSVTVQKDGLEISMSNYDPKEKQVIREIKENKLAYINEVTLPSEPDNSAQGNQLANPVGDSFESKGSDNFANSKANVNISANQEGNSQEVQSQDVKFSVKPTKDADANTEFSYEGDPKFSIRVFHGSGADFEKFDHKFMGTGEGNQAFGWGTYVSEIEGVGRQYAETNPKSKLTYKGEDINNMDLKDWDSEKKRAFRDIADEVGVSHSPRTAIERLKIQYDHNIYNREKIEDKTPAVERELEIYRKIRQYLDEFKAENFDFSQQRHIYEVEIPDDNGSNYLDWKAPLTEDNKADIRAGLLKDEFWRDQEQMTYDDLKDRGLDVPDLEEWLGMRADILTTAYNGEDFYKSLSYALGGDQIASEFLRDCGFTGIKYPTNAMSGGDGKGTHNYVIFNADDAKITNNTKFSFRVPEGKTKAQMQAETDREIAQRRNIVREGDSYEDVLRKAKAIREADELVKIEQTISDNQIKPGDSFDEVLRKAEALKAASAEQQKFAFSREERARRAYEREKKRQQKEINDAQKALRKKIVDEINYLMNDQHLSVFNRSTLSRLLKDVQNADADNIEQTVTSIRTEIDRLTDKSQQRQLDDLLKLKTRDQNGKGMAIAKNVSDSVRRIIGMIRGRVVDLKSTGYEEDMTQLRRQNWFLPGENMRLRRTIERLQQEEPTAERTQDMINAEIAEAEAKIKENEERIEANKAELADLKVRKQEAESAKALAADADVASEIAKLMEKMDEHVAGKGTWTTSDAEKLTALQILEIKQRANNKRREIEDIKGKLAELEDTLHHYEIDARRPQRYVPRQRIEQLRSQVQGMKEAINQATNELIGLNGNVIDAVKELIEEGKSSLQNKIETETNHKYEVLRGVLNDIMGDKQIPTDQQKKKEQQREGTFKKFFSSQLHSFEYLAKRINENSLGEDGWFYNYFVKGKNGVMQAETNHQQGLREAVETLDAKAQQIYGCSYLEASEKNAEVDYHSGVFIYQDANGMEIEEELPLSKGQAMYIYMVWKMPDGRMKLQNQGFTDESIAQVKEFISPEDIMFADWLQDEFLKDRRAKYNDLYVELYNTSMANIENYVPLKILETEVKRDSNISDDSGRKQTLQTQAGALIERTFNLSPVDLTQNAFAIIAKHVNDMEEWHAFARVRKDLDYVLSNTFIRNQLNANSAGRYKQLYDASAIATHAYKPNPAEHMDEVVAWLTKGLVGGNIAFRPSTAIKQILSVPAFYGYSYDPKYWLALSKNIGIQYARNLPAVLANMFTFGWSGKAGFKLADKGKMKSLMSENMMWCMKNVPSFRNRVLKGTSGLEYMDQKLKGKVGELVDKYLDYGMATNQMIDAITCSIGIKSIFDYRYAKLSEGIEKDTSLTPEQKAEALEEAKNQAIMDADIYYNATQQSNHSAFMSPMQMNRSMMNRMFSVYQNASIGYARKTAYSGQTVYKIVKNFDKLQNEYARRYMAEDPNMDRDEAMDKAYKHLQHAFWLNVLNLVLDGYVMNWLWDQGSNGFFGFWGGDKKKERELELRKAAGLEDNIGLRAYDVAAKIGEFTSYPARGLTGMNMASALINGNLKSPLLLFDELDDMQQDVKKYLEDGNYAAIASQTLFHGLKTAGFDARVHYNTLAGVYGMGKAALTGNQDSDFMINLMLALNTPNTNRRAVAEELYKKYPLDTYVSNIMEASKYTDNEYLALFPGMKLLTAKNQMQIYKEFAFNNLTDEEKSKLKDVTKMKLAQLKTTAELTEAYNKETDVKVKEAIGRMIIKNMKDELSKNNTSEDLLKKAKESLLGKESTSKNAIYTALCTANDLVDDEMLKEAIAEYKPVMDQLAKVQKESKGDTAVVNEYKQLHKAEIDAYESLHDAATYISSIKRDLEQAKPELRAEKLKQLRDERHKALTEVKPKDGKKETGK